MANLDWARGFVPFRRLGGTCNTVNYYDLGASNPEIGLYDLVERDANGVLIRAQATSTTIVGVAAEYKVANSGGTLAVYDAPDQTYLAQVDDATVNAQTDLDLNYDINVGAVSNNRSTMEIDGNTQAATATLPIKILRIADVQTEDGNALGANVLVECIINQSILKAGAIG